MTAGRRTTRDRAMTVGAVAGLILVSAVIVLLAAVPPVDRDALTHHLAVPKRYLQQGGMVELPEVPFSYYPMNLELLYLVPLRFGNDIAPKYIHFGFGLLTAGLIGVYVRRSLGGGYAALGMLLFLSLPVIVKLSITVYVDLGLIFFATAAWFELFRWARSGFRPKHLAAAGLFAGLCLGTKPNGMLAVFLLAFCVPFLYGRAAVSGTGESSAVPAPAASRASPGAGGALGWTLLFALIAGLVFSPWMLRNFVWTGNPIYPMARGLFPSKADPAAIGEGAMRGLEPEADEEGGGAVGFGHFAIRKVVFGESLAQILTIPLRVFIEGRDDDPRLFDGRLNPYLLLFPIAAMLPLPRRARAARLQNELRALALFSAGYLLFAFFLTDMRVRYLGPILPPLAILAAFGIHDLADIFRTRFRGAGEAIGRRALAGVVVLLLGLNGWYVVGLAGAVSPWGYVTGAVSREEYIARHRPEYSAIAWANRNLPDEARILALFIGRRIYYSDHPMVSDTEAFARAVRSQGSADRLRAALLDRGITHVLVRVDLFNHWVGFRFDASAKSRLQEFIDRHLEALYEADGHVVLQIRRS